jgi:type 1 glutamine amidotransferase
MFYIAAGHNPASYNDPNFIEILGRGIEWSARQR